MVEKKIYIANDGTQFETERECTNHELDLDAKEFEENIMDEFFSPVYAAWDGDEYRNAFIAKFDTEEDIENCGKYLLAHTGNIEKDDWIECSKSIKLPSTCFVEYDGSFVCVESIKDVLVKAAELAAYLTKYMKD